MSCPICEQWCRRAINPKAITNHHENCPHYNDSLIDVWKVSDGSKKLHCIYSNEADALLDMESDKSDGITGRTITKTKMHREVFEQLGEFDGF
jgi:hypothetical protein